MCVAFKKVQKIIEELGTFEKLVLFIIKNRRNFYDLSESDKSKIINYTNEKDCKTYRR